MSDLRYKRKRTSISYLSVTAWQREKDLNKRSLIFFSFNKRKGKNKTGQTNRAANQVFVLYINVECGRRP
jgi:hypothetical protein